MNRILKRFCNYKCLNKYNGVTIFKVFSISLWRSSSAYLIYVAMYLPYLFVYFNLIIGSLHFIYAKTFNQSYLEVFHFYSVFCFRSWNTKRETLNRPNQVNVKKIEFLSLKTTNQFVTAPVNGEHFFNMNPPINQAVNNTSNNLLGSGFYGYHKSGERFNKVKTAQRKTAIASHTTKSMPGMNFSFIHADTNISPSRFNSSTEWCNGRSQFRAVLIPSHELVKTGRISCIVVQPQKPIIQRLRGFGDYLIFSPRPDFSVLC